VSTHGDLRDAAVEYAAHHWPVFPLRGKIPAIAGGRGVLDATTDIAIVTTWWTGRYAGCNIGGRIPESMIMVDTDPYHGGLDTLAELEARHGRLPETLTDLSGRGDGGAHYFFRRPPGKLIGTRLGPGIDLKTSTGYGVLPPSVHPDTGKPYTRIERPVAAPPGWLIRLLRPEPAPPRKPCAGVRFFGPSAADEYSANTSWADILGPHGWRCTDADPDSDGARWLHPTATSACSATVRNSCLFVWSTNTVFNTSEPGYPRGYTRFKAYALLNFDGDMSAAAQALRGAA
jgi:Bifunctional DNA primase/polymerase, N-terminal